MGLEKALDKAKNFLLQKKMLRWFSFESWLFSQASKSEFLTNLIFYFMKQIFEQPVKSPNQTLNEALLAGNLDAVKEALQNEGAIENERPTSQYSPFHEAFAHFRSFENNSINKALQAENKENLLEILNLLFEKEAKVADPKETNENNKKNSLLVACSQDIKDLNIIKLIVSKFDGQIISLSGHGLSKEEVVSRYEEYLTHSFAPENKGAEAALNTALLAGDLEAVKKALEDGGAIKNVKRDYRDKRFYTNPEKDYSKNPINLALQATNKENLLEILGLLFDKGAEAVSSKMLSRGESCYSSLKIAEAYCKDPEHYKSVCLIAEKCEQKISQDYLDHMNNSKNPSNTTKNTDENENLVDGKIKTKAKAKAGCLIL